MVKTGAAALGSALLSAAATKIVAVWLGPLSVALMASLSQVRQTGVIAATANGQTALVQGLNALEGRERGAYLRTSLALIGAATLLTAAVMIFARKRVAIAPMLFLASDGVTAFLAIAVVLGSAAAVMMALLNALGEIGRLTWLQLAGPAAMTLLALPMALAGFRALPWMLVGSSAATVGVGAWLLRGLWKIPGAWMRESTAWWDWRAARRFVSISGAMAATGLIANAALIAVRLHMMSRAGFDATGNFDAAWAISMNQVTLVLASMQTYYLPELARERTPAAQREQVTTVMKSAIAASAPVIAAIGIAKPLVISILYSHRFSGAADILRWTLVGDYLKVTSWVLAMSMIAAADMRAFVLTDTLVQIVFLGSSWILANLRGSAEGAAMAFVACYAVNLMVCYGYTRRRTGWRFGAVAWWWLAGLALVCGANIF